MVVRIKHFRDASGSSTRSSCSRRITASVALVLVVCQAFVLTEGVWYSEICHTGPRYKVRVDPTTGKVVPVFPQDPNRERDQNAQKNGGLTSDGVFYDNSHPFSNNKVDTIAATKENGENNSNNNAIPPIPVLDQDYDPVEASILDSAASNQARDEEEVPERRVLRSNRFWRDVDEDLESDALVVTADNQLHQDFLHNRNDLVEADPSIAAAFARRFLQDEPPSMHEGAKSELDMERYLNHGSFPHEHPGDLNEGEFYVKPCLCATSRWTFRDDAATSVQHTTVYNSTTDTIIQNPQDNTGDEETDGSSSLPPEGASAPPVSYGNNPTVINIYTKPNSFGVHPNGQYIFVPDNLPGADMYLCNVQAMYCGVPVVDGTGEPRVRCYAQNMRHIIARNAWPLILLWYFGLAVICCCTVHGRTAGDYVHDRALYLAKKFLCCCFRERIRYDFNDRMLNRMIDDDERERQRRNRNSSQNDDDSMGPHRPWCYSRQRRQFERSLLAQVQWIWRHQEYIREMTLRAQGLPPPQLRLRTKQFRMETSTSRGIAGGFSTDFTATESTSSGKTNNDNNNNNNSSLINDTKNEKLDQEFSCTICPPSDETNDGINSPQQDEETKEDENVKDSSEDGEGDEEFVKIDLGPGVEDGKDPPEVIDGNSVVEESYNDDLDSLEEPTCAICMMPFEEGDRIADLTCKHEFHVECLKGWVQRKNACPLCNVRLGRPERPPPPPPESANEGNNSEIDGSSRHSSGLMQRLFGGSSGSHSINNNPVAALNTGSTAEIHRTSRIGMIGSISAADDALAAASNARSRNQFTW